MDVFKRPVVIIIVLVAIIIAIIWSYVGSLINARKAAEQSDQSTISIIDLSNIDAQEFDEVFRAELAIAKAKAEAIDPKNKLIAIEVTLPSLELRTGDIRYVYASESDTYNNWAITFSRSTGNYLRADIPKEDYLGSLPAINASLWKFNYVTALQIAEKNGGLDWREQNGLDTLNIVLKHSNDNLVWTVTYESGESSKSLIIDAATGKII